MVFSSLFSLPLSFHAIVCMHTSNRLCGFVVSALRRYAYVIRSISLLRTMAEESNRNRRSTEIRFRDVKVKSEVRTCSLRVSSREVHFLISRVSPFLPPSLSLSLSLSLSFSFALFCTIFLSLFLLLSRAIFTRGCRDAATHSNELSPFFVICRVYRLFARKRVVKYIEKNGSP